MVDHPRECQLPVADENQNKPVIIINLNSIITGALINLNFENTCENLRRGSDVQTVVTIIDFLF